MAGSVTLQNTSPTIQTADPEAFQKAIVNQGHLLEQHQQVLIGVTHSLEALTQKQTEQQTQLVPFVAFVKELTSHLQTLGIAANKEHCYSPHPH